MRSHEGPSSSLLHRGDRHLKVPKCPIRSGVLKSMITLVTKITFCQSLESVSKTEDVLQEPALVFSRKLFLVL